jgi:hypothetical protein
MTPHRTRSALLAVIFPALLATHGLVTPAAATNTSSAPTNAQIRSLQGQIRGMQEQLDELGNAGDQATRQRLMQQNWQSMLDYMQQMQSMPWMTGSPNAMGPGMMGRGMMGRRHARDWMSGCPIVGGPGSGWQLPPNIGADQYRSEMSQNMQRMQEQMTEIGSIQDPARRKQLLDQHWRDIYRNMQTMRGMGWMWGGPGSGGQDAAGLPDPDSRGAELVSQYCTQCHARPSPKLHSASEWKAVISRMKQNMKNFRNANWRGVHIPSDAEFSGIVEYMQKYAR